MQRPPARPAALETLATGALSDLASDGPPTRPPYPTGMLRFWDHRVAVLGARPRNRCCGVLVASPGLIECRHGAGRGVFAGGQPLALRQEWRAALGEAAGQFSRL